MNEMLKLPDIIFKTINAATANKIKFIELDKEMLVIKYFRRMAHHLGAKAI
jgi:hypothetical protein